MGTHEKTSTGTCVIRRGMVPKRKDHDECKRKYAALRVKYNLLQKKYIHVKNSNKYLHAKYMKLKRKYEFVQDCIEDLTVEDDTVGQCHSCGAVYHTYMEDREEAMIKNCEECHMHVCTYCSVYIGDHEDDWWRCKKYYKSDPDSESS